MEPEIELAFVLGKPLKGPGVGLLEVLRATEFVVPASLSRARAAR